MPNWPTIPESIIATDTVTIRRVSWSQDRVRGRVPSYDADADPVPCSVVGTSATEMHAHSRDEMVAKYKVTFTDDRGIRMRDLLDWTQGGKTFVVIGVVPVGDVGSRTWTAYCEDHPES